MTTCLVYKYPKAIPCPVSLQQVIEGFSVVCIADQITGATIAIIRDRCHMYPTKFKHAKPREKPGHKAMETSYLQLLLGSLHFNRHIDERGLSHLRSHQGV